jgi:polyisoprenoid-binding protein YceI
MRTFLFAAVATLALGAAPTQAAEVFDLDTSHAYAHFGVSHLGFSTMYGRIDTTGGEFALDLETMTGSISVELDPASIDTGHTERDNHLRSPDFLNVVEFPQMRYVAESVELTESGGRVQGALTLHGQTRSVPLTISAWRCGDNPMSGVRTCGFDASGAFNRSDFGMRYAVPAVGDTITVMIGIEGTLRR